MKKLKKGIFTKTTMHKFLSLSCKELHRELGHEHNGAVYTLFSRHSKDTDELGFTDGERLTILHRHDDQWWMAENSKGKRGVVPCTYLGPYKPTNLGTLL